MGVFFIMNLRGIFQSFARFLNPKAQAQTKHQQPFISPVPQKQQPAPMNNSQPKLIAPIPQSQVIPQAQNRIMAQMPPMPQPQQQSQQPQDPFSQYRDTIYQAAQQNHISPSWLAGALARESGNFDPKYVKGYHMDGTGRGIAGIDKVYHPEVSDQQAFDPNFAINWMAQQYAKTQQDTGDPYDGYREYNGGPNYASDAPGYGGAPVWQNTAQNADAVQQLANQYMKYYGY